MSSLWVWAAALAALALVVHGQTRTRNVLLERVNPVLEVTVGERLKLRVTSAQPIATSTWYKNGNELRSKPQRLRVAKNWLRFKPVKVGDTGRYACRLETEAGVEWRNISMEVEKLGGKDVLTDIDGFAGDEQGSGDLGLPLPLLKVNTIDEMESSYKVKVKSVGVDKEIEPLTAMSLVDPTELEDSNDAEGTEREGSEGGNKAGSFNATEEASPPVFKNKDKMFRVVAKPAGNMLRLKCPAEGNPSPNITWTKNGATPERHLGSVHYGRWAIMLEDLVTTDSGNYTCVVCNTYGCIDFTFKVDILERFPHKPYIKDGYPRNVTALVNTSVTFECPPISDLEPFIQWVRVGYFLTGSLDKVEDIPNATRIQAGSDCNYMGGSDSSVDCKSPELLLLHNVTYDDAGWYTCIAGNSLGIIYASAYLQVVDSKTPFVEIVF